MSKDSSDSSLVSGVQNSMLHCGYTLP